MAEGAGWQSVRLDELDRIPVEGADVTWRPIRRRLGLRAFGLNAYSADRAGEQVVEEHTEEFMGHEEVYVVVTGRARFTLDGEELNAPAGTLVHLPDTSVRRAAIAEEPGTTVLAIGSKPGEVFQPSAWEWSFAASPHYHAGEYEAGLEIVRRGLDEQPGNPVMLYQVACYEALAGRREQAIEHLREAVGRDERIVGWARRDDDFASLRSDPAFTAIVGG
jgi:quercetin dioxygenase-like cupin family protein